MADSFPVADCIIGNHDRVVMRRAFSSSIPSVWIKSFNEVLGTSWNWTERIEYDGVQYCTAKAAPHAQRQRTTYKARCRGIFIPRLMWNGWLAIVLKLFGMQVGCGLDRETYAAAYAKHYKKQAIGCGVVIGGHTAINCLMPL